MIVKPSVMSKQIVVVEDDADILALMQYILAEQGYQVICYSRPETAKELTQHRPSLILMDNRLTTMRSGNSFCAEIKADPSTNHIPVILVSASGDLEQIAEKCQADGFLSKPFNLDDLVGLVNLHISNSTSFA